MRNALPRKHPRLVLRTPAQGQIARMAHIRLIAPPKTARSTAIPSRLISANISGS
ncbi:hypothetical protein P3W85_16555 [Cupriavidus basilensis]|uniref:Uncharacterized protein n=1 Tax=Cupriavidus basilensis TaxID=68895 RepID=A0ABT6APK0_9BURK|nr:hypothetical protein [Cupriavidus basilensis]MDF3834555.1 hypothetical protein [Cupriavidus basilensis]